MTRVLSARTRPSSSSRIGLRLRPARTALRRIQERLRAHAPASGSAVDELIAERRAEPDG